MRKKVNNALKKILIIYGGILLILAITCIIVYISYNKKVKESAKQSLLAAEKLTAIVPNNDIFAEASTEISKTINEAIEETKNAVIENQTEQADNENINNEAANQVIETQNTQPDQNIEPVAVVEEPVKELEFMYPVEGEILKEFAIDNLVFSETLQEWVVHKGIDIKAPRTTVVKSAEEGTIQAIKNDPRYGLAIIVEHRDGFKTIYSNLLTTEFVKEGENVSKGQSLGTVGNSAAFEIADEPHLHFEMTKDDETIDPKLYLK